MPGDTVFYSMGMTLPSGECRVNPSLPNAFVSADENVLKVGTMENGRFFYAAVGIGEAFLHKDSTDQRLDADMGQMSVRVVSFNAHLNVPEETELTMKAGETRAYLSVYLEDKGDTIPSFLPVRSSNWAIRVTAPGGLKSRHDLIVRRLKPEAQFTNVQIFYAGNRYKTVRLHVREESN